MWNCFQAIGKRGVIDGFTDSGGVIVKYQDNKWVFNPKALGKVLIYTVKERLKNYQIGKS